MYRFGPFESYYDSWFGELKKAINYNNKRVCFREFYLKPEPGIGLYWNIWGQKEVGCTVAGASPLHQGLNLYIRNQWLRKYGESSLKYPGWYILLLYLLSKG